MAALSHVAGQREGRQPEGVSSPAGLEILGHRQPGTRLPEILSLPETQRELATPNSAEGLISSTLTLEAPSKNGFVATC